MSYQRSITGVIGGGGGATLTPTAVKAANYTLAPGDLVPFDLTAASRVGTLPTTPADKSQFFAYIKAFGAGHTLTLTAGGSDVIEQADGTTATTLTRTLGAGQSIWLQYDAANHLFRQISDRLPLVLLDARYVPIASAVALPADAAGALTNNGSGTLSWAAAAAALTVQDENTNVGTAVTQIDFQGAGVTATAGTGEVVVTIPGGATVAVTTVAASGSAQTLTVGATRMVLSANCTFTMPSATAGVLSVVDLTLVQDGTGSRTVTWPSSVKWPGGTAPTLTTTAGRADRIRLTSDDGGVSWYGQVLGQNYTPGSGSTVPGAPTGLTLGTATTTTQPLSWTAPSSDGGSAITDYVVQYAIAGSGSWSTFADGTSTATSATVTGLTAGTSYDYRVAAVNGVGTGSNSSTATGSTSSSSGAIALANSYTQNFTSAASPQVVTGVTAASGTIAVAVFQIASGSTVNRPNAITDAGGNTWTKQQESLGTAGQNTMMQIWTAPITTALTSANVSVAFTGTAKTMTAQILVFTGATLTGLVGANDNLNGVPSGTPTAVTVTTTGAAAVIGGITYNNSTAPTGGPGTGFTNVGGASSTTGVYGIAAYAIKSTAGTYGPAWTMTSVSHGACTIGLAST